MGRDRAAPKPRRRARGAPSAAGEGGARWYQDAVIYQVHVRSFADGDDDGVGDFAGLTGKLDYLQGLGVTALWLLPFYPSPLRDDGYDIADYTGVNPAYGTLKDFRRFLREAHRRGLKVITELVVNHTSDQHPWFQRARRAAPDSRERRFYVWSDTPERYRETRIIFKDFEPSNWSWDPVGGAYYWHRFYHHQPDLNFDEPAVHRALVQAMDHWFKMGVDGMRLDAVPYLFEREGTNCENLPETHAFLKQLRSHVDERFDDRMLLAEANQWPEDAIAYFGDGDECHMAFHFPVMPRLFMALRQEDRFPVIDILEQTPPIPEGCQWATFLRNHDELTLEMVTDEDRDYMYRVYAGDPRARINLGIRRRLAPLLDNDRRRVELMNALLFSLPGTPVIYYGDEIGMGDNFYLGDRNGVRTPMQWSSDRNAGFSRSNPQRLFLPVIVDPEYHYEAVNVAAQEQNPHSLLWWMRRLIAQRKRRPAFSRGTLEFLYPHNHRVLAFVRRFEEERILVVANLSRFAQHVELDLAGQAPDLVGVTPVELFGRTPFPRIGELPYLLTLGPHGFYWFSLERDRGELTQRPIQQLDEAAAPPLLEVAAGWEELVDTGSGRRLLEAELPAILRSRRWLAERSRSPREASIVHRLPLRDTGSGLDARLLAVRTEVQEGEAETYLLPVAYAGGEQGRRLAHEQPWAVLARVESARGGSGVLFDAVHDHAFCRALLAAVAGKRRLREDGVELAGLRAAGFEPPEDLETIQPFLPGGGRPNTTVYFDQRLVLKLYRRIEPGIHPEIELGRFLTERAGFPHAPPLAGWLELRSERDEPCAVAAVHAFAANEDTAWRLTLDAVGRYFERLSVERRDGGGRAGSLLEPGDGAAGPRPIDLVGRPLPEPGGELLGAFPGWARRLGERTAELHLTLAGAEGEAGGDPELAPEPFTTLYQRSLYQSMRAGARRTLGRLERLAPGLPPNAARLGGELLDRRDELLDRFNALRERRFEALRTRIHGDYHLGQTLYTGRDFQIIGLGGPELRPLSERRFKRSPLRDVAGMLRSLHYAAFSARVRFVESGVAAAPEVDERWAEAWYGWLGAAFLGAYLDRVGSWEALPGDRGDLGTLLDLFVLDRALAELGDELEARPESADIPVRGALAILGPR